MITISAVVIAHNEASQLQRCLESLTWVNEIIGVDCNSTDETSQIFQQFGVKLFRRPNLENLNINKNFGIEQASGDWILSVDADEIIPLALQKEIIQKLSQNNSYMALSVPRRNYFFNRWLKRGGQYPDRQLRLFQKGKACFPNQHVPEHLTVDGPIGHLSAHFEHYPYNTVQQMLRKIDFYTSFEARYFLNKKRTLSTLELGWGISGKPILKFIRRYFF